MHTYIHEITFVSLSYKMLLNTDRQNKKLFPLTLSSPDNLSERSAFLDKFTLTFTFVFFFFFFFLFVQVQSRFAV
ncbi:hypothetical protein PUN28_015121 [Cardiocondyla obscurior]|uniref:Uncharacterized protein n=1 Tax=Cardiocondyla obscurior TaxID=286306 RepID=A0AAW2F0L8_9HYME